MHMYLYKYIHIYIYNVCVYIYTHTYTYRHISPMSLRKSSSNQRDEHAVDNFNKTVSAILIIIKKFIGI